MSDYSSDEEVVEFRRRNEASRRARELARQKWFTEDAADVDADYVKKMTSTVSDRISDEYEEVISKSRDQDAKTMEYIDRILKQTSLSAVPSRTAGVPRWYRRNDHVRDEVSFSNGMQQPRTSEFESESLIGKRRSSETARQRVRRIEAKLDGILDYELPSAENFKNMRHSLREIHDKMSTHKNLLSRRTSYDLDEDDNRKVPERIDEKYRELEERMPCLSASGRSKSLQRSSRFDPNLIPGYITGLSVTDWGQSAELRGRIRTLLCRTRKSNESDNVHTTTARRRRETTGN